MKRMHFLQLLSHLPRRIVRESLMILNVVQFFLVNRLGRKQATEPGGPVVSMTTYGRRSEKTYYAIESIARGRVRPSRLILWIDDDALLKNLPPTMRRLQKRGLEVKRSKNYGPHEKYYPYVESQETFDTPLVTADDDVLYPKYWLGKLVEAHRLYGSAINCFFAHVIAVDENGFRRYKDNKLCESTLPSFLHLAAGVAGVIYPPSFLTVLRHAGTAFEFCCPKGDDLWLHAQALRAGYKVRQILPCLPYFRFHSVPGTQKIALCHENVDFGDGNERQIRATYNQDDIRILQRECGVVSDQSK